MYIFIHFDLPGQNPVGLNPVCGYAAGTEWDLTTHLIRPGMMGAEPLSQVLRQYPELESTWRAVTTADSQRAAAIKDHSVKQSAVTPHHPPTTTQLVTSARAYVILEETNISLCVARIHLIHQNALLMYQKVYSIVMYKATS